MDRLPWEQVFPDGDHRFSFGLRRCPPPEYWRARDASGQLLGARRAWVAQNASAYVAILPASEVAVDEALAWMAASAGLSGRRLRPEEAAVSLEPDWVVLTGAQNVVVGGAVVFPSSWALGEKLGQPLFAVHRPVPGLNAALGPQVDAVLSRLKPGVGWRRPNWGLAATPERNLHLAQPRPALHEASSLSGTWLRVEEQFLTRLPATGAVLFGIRLDIYRLDCLVRDFPEAAQRLARTLGSLDDDVAHYKELATARRPLAAALAAG